jgi:hypothetical protein
VLGVHQVGCCILGDFEGARIGTGWGYGREDGCQGLEAGRGLETGILEAVVVDIPEVVVVGRLEAAVVAGSSLVAVVVAEEDSHSEEDPIPAEAAEVRKLGPSQVQAHHQAEEDPSPAAVGAAGSRCSPAVPATWLFQSQHAPLSIRDLAVLAPGADVVEL